MPPALTMFPPAAWPVPGAVPLAALPPEVQRSWTRILIVPPKPVVTAAVMNTAQFSMLAPDLPWVSNL